ncbi:MAG: hypothetical protein M1816_005154 [Peltula sp. TS41687]|nr:MAG: hypothetical protein M1816_005154 [Peltula sp. TS41687]
MICFVANQEQQHSPMVVQLGQVSIRILLPTGLSKASFVKDFLRFLNLSAAIGRTTDFRPYNNNNNWQRPQIPAGQLSNQYCGPSHPLQITAGNANPQRGLQQGLNPPNPTGDRGFNRDSNRWRPGQPFNRGPTGNKSGYQNPANRPTVKAYQAEKDPGLAEDEQVFHQDVNNDQDPYPDLGLPEEQPVYQNEEIPITEETHASFDCQKPSLSFFNSHHSRSPSSSLLQLSMGSITEAKKTFEFHITRAGARDYRKLKKDIEKLLKAKRLRHKTITGKFEWKKRVVEPVQGLGLFNKFTANRGKKEEQALDATIDDVAKKLRDSEKDEVEMMAELKGNTDWDTDGNTVKGDESDDKEIQKVSQCYTASFQSQQKATEQKEEVRGICNGQMPL